MCIRDSLIYVYNFKCGFTNSEKLLSVLVVLCIFGIFFFLDVALDSTLHILLFHPIYYLRPSFSLSLLDVTQIRGHIAGSSPHLPTTVRALNFYRGKTSALSSLVDSRRIVLTHSINRRPQHWMPFFIFFASEFKSHHGGIRTHGPTLQTVVIHSI